MLQKMLDLIMPNSNGKKKVTIEIAKDQLAIMTLLASQNNMSVEEWAVTALTAAVPKELKEKSRDNSVDDLVEQMEEAGAPVKSTTQAVLDTYLLHVQNKSVEEARRSQTTHDTSHACIHLSNEANQFFRATECEGTCTHPRNRRVCTWASQVAHNCPYFEAKRHHYRKPTV